MLGSSWLTIQTWLVPGRAARVRGLRPTSFSQAAVSTPVVTFAVKPRTLLRSGLATNTRALLSPHTRLSGLAWKIGVERVGWPEVGALMTVWRRLKVISPEVFVAWTATR